MFVNIAKTRWRHGWHCSCLGDMVREQLSLPRVADLIRAGKSNSIICCWPAACLGWERGSGAWGVVESHSFFVHCSSVSRCSANNLLKRFAIKQVERQRTPPPLIFFWGLCCRQAWIRRGCCYLNLQSAIKANTFALIAGTLNRALIIRTY